MKNGMKDAATVAIGCSVFALWVVLIFWVGMKNMKAGLCIAFLPFIAFGVWGIIGAIGCLLQKKYGRASFAVLGMATLLIAVPLMLIHSCHSAGVGDGLGASHGSIVVTNKQVKDAAFIAVRMAAKASGVGVSGFAVDDCIISGAKAVCHFHCDANGKRHIGGIEFRIENGKLIPSGNFYLDAD